MRFKKINYNIIKKWHDDCLNLLEIYKSDDALPMEMEWALYQNYKLINSIVSNHMNQINALEEKYGTLQEDGSKKLDTTSNVVMELYNKELQELQNKQFTIRIETINHKYLRGLKGVTLDVMSLLDFMID